VRAASTGDWKLEARKEDKVDFLATVCVSIGIRPCVWRECVHVCVTDQKSRHQRPFFVVDSLIRPSCTSIGELEQRTVLLALNGAQKERRERQKKKQQAAAPLAAVNVI